MYDLITIGDTVLDVFLELDEATVSCDINKDACLLCLNYAEKIPVKEVTKIAGVGNSANVAVGASRLGLKSAIYTVLGNDDLAEEIKTRFIKEKVGTEFVHIDKKYPTNYSSVLLYKGERTILTHKEIRDYKLPPLSKTKWLYFSSIGSNHGKLDREIVRYLKKHKVKLGFNPGTSQLRHGLKHLAPLLEQTTVLFVNKEEAQVLLGESINEIEELLRLMHKKGPEIVVITDAERGSYAFDGEEMHFLKSLKVKMKERTGAGDSYATGFISALISGKKVSEAMVWGTLNAVSVVQFIGAQEGLLTKSKMMAAKRKHPGLKAKLMRPKIM